MKLDNAVTITSEVAHNYPNVKILKGDILLALTGATIGKSALFDLDEECYLNQRVAIFRPRKNILKDFLLLYINSDLFRTHIDYVSYGGAQDNVGKPQILNAKIPLPPLNEQEKIVSKYKELESQFQSKKLELEKQLSEIEQAKRKEIFTSLTGI